MIPKEGACMAVLRRKRAVAFTEFERQMANICKELNARLNTLPARYHKYLDRRIYEPANQAYTDTILANEQNSSTPGAIEKRRTFFEDALLCLAKLQPPLLAYWNLKDSSEGGMDHLADMVNREYALIYGVMKRTEAPPMMLTLPRQKAKELQFIKTMCDLHKYSYQKIGHAPAGCTDFIGQQLAALADAALYHVIAANRKMPETKQEALQRAQHLQEAIDSLNGMQRPVLALWNLMDYSERTMDEWAGLIDAELKLLEGLKKADKGRFSALP